MIKKINGSDKLIISHIADIDGMGGVILGKLAFNNIDYALLEFNELDNYLENLSQFEKYKEIYIIDICVRNKSISLIENSFLKNKVVLFDHHESDVDTNKYDWANVICINKDNVLTCGTSLFYDYLVENCNIESNLSYSYFVEAIRNYDNNGPLKLKGNRDGIILTDILSVIGVDSFISNYYNKLNTDKKTFSFSEEELKISSDLKNRINNYINLCEKNLYDLVLNNNTVGLSVSNKYRSMVGNVLSEKYKDKYDYILIADFERDKFSTRTVNNINLSEICQSFGGGGHKGAGGFDMTEENINIVDSALKKKYKTLTLNKNLTV